jgi:hypothetical protein
MLIRAVDSYNGKRTREDSTPAALLFTLLTWALTDDTRSADREGVTNGADTPFAQPLTFIRQVWVRESAVRLGGSRSRRHRTN